MRYRAVCFDTRNEKNVRRFLHFPSSLYSKEQLTQDIAAERALLKGEHILSHYFTVYPFLVSDENGNTAARCMLTVYHGQTCAYIGFFECINERYAAHCLFRAAEEKARRLGCDRLIGPFSSYSRWASFIGEVPLCFLESKDQQFTDDAFSKIVDYFHFENGKEILDW